MIHGQALSPEVGVAMEKKPVESKRNVQHVWKLECTKKTRITSVQRWVVAESVTTLMITTKGDVGGAGNMGKECWIRTPALPQREIGTIAMSSGRASRESADQKDLQ